MCNYSYIRRKFSIGQSVVSCVAHHTSIWRHVVNIVSKNSNRLLPERNLLNNG